MPIISSITPITTNNNKQILKTTSIINSSFLATNMAARLTTIKYAIKTATPPKLGTLPLWEVRLLTLAVRFLSLLTCIRLGIILYTINILNTIKTKPIQ